MSAFGEKSVEVAPAWFEYGRALLLKEQESPSDDLLGAVAAEAKKQAQTLGQALGGDQEEEVCVSALVVSIYYCRVCVVC